MLSTSMETNGIKMVPEGRWIRMSPGSRPNHVSSHGAQVMTAPKTSTASPMIMIVFPTANSSQPEERSSGIANGAAQRCIRFATVPHVASSRRPAHEDDSAAATAFVYERQGRGPWILTGRPFGFIMPDPAVTWPG
jgi:hypothetical protein